MSLLALLVYLIIAVLVIWCVRLLLPMTGLPTNIQTVIIVILSIIFLVWFLGRWVPLRL